MNTIDIDTGGTFTDGVFRLADRVVTIKVDTTPHDPVKCFTACIGEGASALGMAGPRARVQGDPVVYREVAAQSTTVTRGTASSRASASISGNVTSRSLVQSPSSASIAAVSSSRTA